MKFCSIIIIVKFEISTDELFQISRKKDKLCFWNQKCFISVFCGWNSEKAYFHIWNYFSCQKNKLCLGKNVLLFFGKNTFVIFDISIFEFVKNEFVTKSFVTYTLFLLNPGPASGEHSKIWFSTVVNINPKYLHCTKNEEILNGKLYSLCSISHSDCGPWLRFFLINQ